MKKENYCITRQFQQDLMESYIKVSEHCWSQHEAYEKMVLQPAPRYYVSAKQALQIISPMMKGDFEKFNMMMPLKREMYRNLFDEVVKLSEKREFVGKSLIGIIRFAILQPAPRFYIGPTRARIIRHFIKSGKYDSEGRVRVEMAPWYITGLEKKNKKNRELRERKRQWMLEKMSEEEKI